MKTIRSELRKLGLTNDMSEPKVSSSLETMLINSVSKEEVSARCLMTRKGIRERNGLYNCHEKHHGKPKILYKKGGEKRMPKVSEVKTMFIKTLVEHMIGSEGMKVKDLVNIMKNRSSGPGKNENAIRNFLMIAKYNLPQLITNENNLWQIDKNISVEQFMEMYLETLPRFWKRNHRKPKEISKPRTEGQRTKIETKKSNAIRHKRINLLHRH